MKLRCMGAIALVSVVALAGCGGEEPPGPQPAFADAGAPSGPAGSRWSETGGGAARSEVEATASSVSGLVTPRQEHAPKVNSILRDRSTGKMEHDGAPSHGSLRKDPADRRGELRAARRTPQ